MLTNWYNYPRGTSRDKVKTESCRLAEHVTKSSRQPIPPLSPSFSSSVNKTESFVSPKVRIAAARERMVTIGREGNYEGTGRVAKRRNILKENKRKRMGGRAGERARRFRMARREISFSFLHETHISYACGLCVFCLLLYHGIPEGPRFYIFSLSPPAPSVPVPSST